MWQYHAISFARTIWGEFSQASLGDAAARKLGRSITIITAGIMASLGYGALNWRAPRASLGPSAVLKSHRCMFLMSWLAKEDGESCAEVSRPRFASDAAIPSIKSPLLLRPLYHFPFFHAAAFLPVLSMSVPFPAFHNAYCLCSFISAVPYLPCPSLPRPLCHNQTLMLRCGCHVLPRSTLVPVPFAHVRLATC